MAKKILVVVGTRPNFIKVTRLESVIHGHDDLEMVLVHTGQHYDDKMSKVFFDQLELRQPDYYLGIESSDPVDQIGKIIIELNKVFAEVQPDCALVVGDVNSTMAASIVANKHQILLGHIESGLRSNDRSMPEEHNRMITDAVADLYFVTEPSGLENLKDENKSQDSIHFVGNTMIDTLVKHDAQIKESKVLSDLGIEDEEFVLMTMHRPGNVDNAESLTKLVSFLEYLCADRKVVLPIHPRTLKRLEEFDLKGQFDAIEGLVTSGPLDYFSFQKLILDCDFVVTDSGGIQEETTFRQTPCLTLRPNTERPVTLDIGSNTLVPFDLKSLQEQVELIDSGNYKQGAVPEKWDGHASERIIDVVINSI